MLNKRDIINFLFVSSFPLYGLGAFVSGAFSSSGGYFVSIFAHILIIVFYLIDLVYFRNVEIRVNWFYYLFLLFQLTCVASLFIALGKNLPSTNALGTWTRSILGLVPFQAFVIFFLYNEKHKQNLVRLTFLSFSILLFINLIGYFVLGMSNAIHSIEGRFNFPFLDGFYSGACLIAIMNLMLLSFIKKSFKDPIRLTYLICYFVFNFVLLYYINSRLSLLIFLGVFFMFAFNLSRRFRGVFLVSVFFLPILLNIGIFIYRVLSLPVFVAIIQRVNLADVTTFNGRSFIWQRAIDWMLYDQRGLWFGNGSSGHYFLHLIPDLAIKFGAPNEASLHLHSSTLITIVDQGIFGFALLLLVSYRIYVYYRTEFQKNNQEGTFFAVVVFLIFVMQVDTFGYFGTLGYAIMALLAARAALNLKASEF
jgi:O-Antigen ligase